MNRWQMLLLFSLGLIVVLIVASAQEIPGYLDADYYFAGGLQLVRGLGFTEPYLWNYLDDPEGLPHPSHGYWMPLASVLAALGMWVTGQESYAAARLGFILLAALAPPLTATLAYRFSERRDLALASGLLAVFSVYHLSFMPVTDNYPIYMILGGLYFLSMSRARPWFWLGMISGLLNLARTDGLLWFGLSVLLAVIRLRPGGVRRTEPGPSLRELLIALLLVAAGFLLIMGPWYARNLGVYGSIMSPGGARALWLTVYDETFAYPASQLTPESWLASGWPAIARVRLRALGINLQSLVAAQGHLVLFPLIALGMWRRRTDQRVRLGALAWLGLMLVMTLVFPFAGARGSFFHAGAALQPLLWSLAPIGLDSAVEWIGHRRGWIVGQAQTVFRIAMVQMVILLSAYLVWFRIFDQGWEEGEYLYPKAADFLEQHGLRPNEPVIVLNPPGYHIMTGWPAIVQPYGGPETVLAVSDRFGARFFVFEPEGQLAPLRDLYIHPDSFPGFRFLGEVDGARIFEIRSDD